MKTPAVPLGSSAPDFTLPDLTGQLHRLASRRGHSLILLFYRGHW